MQNYVAYTVYDVLSVSFVFQDGCKLHDVNVKEVLYFIFQQKQVLTYWKE